MIPTELQQYPNWINWDFKKRSDGKITKVPMRIGGGNAAVNDPSSWSTYYDAITASDRIGFVFSDTIPYFGIDLDNCFTEENTLKEWAQKIIAEIDTYTEVSQSGKGLHLIGRFPTKFQGSATKWTNDQGQMEGIECYSQGRFFIMTGNVYEGRDTIKEFNDIIAWKDKTFRKEKVLEQPKVETVVKPSLPSDEDIIRVAKRAKNGTKFTVLYDGGDWQALGFGSQSEADLALISMIGFYACGDEATIDRLFRASKLYRPKWDEKHFSSGATYGQNTIQLYKKNATEFMEWAIEPSIEELAGNDLLFKSIVDITGDTDGRDWLWDGYIARGYVTLFSTIWKAGKTTFLVHLAKKLAKGEPFLYQDTKKSNILFISEENESLWAERKEIYNLDENPNIFIASLPFANLSGGRPQLKEWNLFMKTITAQAKEHNISFIIIDTLANLGGIENENDAPEVVKWLQISRSMAAMGIAVMIVHHTTKDSKGIDTSMRGSGAFGGFVDAYMNLTRPKGEAEDTTLRELGIRGRMGFAEERLTLNLANKDTPQEEYTVVGNTRLVDSSRKIDVIFEVLSEKDDDGNYKKMTLREILSSYNFITDGVPIKLKNARDILEKYSERIQKFKGSRKVEGRGRGEDEYQLIE